MRKIKDQYIHRGKWVFESGLEMELLQEFFFVSLDIFFEIEDNKNREESLGELEAWLYFLGSDRPEDIRKVIASDARFAQMYEEIRYFRYHPEEALHMFSKALEKLDENTAKYMIEELKQEIDAKEKEIDAKDKEIAELKRKLSLAGAGEP